MTNYHLEEVQKELDSKDRTIRFLRKQNEELKNGLYKDKEFARIKAAYEEMSADYYRGFPISEEADKKIDKWIKEHTETAHRNSKGGGGRYQYIFTPTSLGTLSICRCQTCGVEFDFTEDFG